MNSSVRRFNDEISKIVEDCQKEDLNIEYVSVEEGFDGHEAYSDDSYINSIKPIANKEDLNDLAPVSAYSMHPNLKGAQVYANCVQKAINNWEKRRASQSRLVLLLIQIALTNNMWRHRRIRPSLDHGQKK